MIYAILIGTLVGFLAGRLVHGTGYGFIRNLLLGIAGGLAGHFLFGILGFATTGLVGDIIAGTIGAVLLVLLFGKRRGRLI